MFFRFIITIILLSTISIAWAQDNSNFSHYFMNPYSINPSFAGTDGRPSVFLTYRKQWVDIEGAPAITNLSFHTPMGKRLGFGLNATNFKRGVLNTSTAYLTNSVNISFSEKVSLRFGASVGAASNTIDMEELSNLPPSSLAGLLDQNTYLVGNAGLSLQAKHFNFGVSIPSLFNKEVTTTESFAQGGVEPLGNLIIFASNRFYLTREHKHIIEPYLLYRYSDVLPAQLEASMIIHLNHTVWFGGAYKQDFGISALGGVKFGKVFGLGYVYSLKNTGDNEINSPSHEIQLNLLLGGRKKDRFVYSFVDSALPKKKTKRQEAIEKRHEEIAQKEAEEKEKAKLLAEQKAKENADQKHKFEEARLAKAEEAKLAKEEQAKIAKEEQTKVNQAEQETKAKEEQTRIAKEESARRIEEEKRLEQQRKDQQNVKLPIEEKATAKPAIVPPVAKNKEEVPVTKPVERPKSNQNLVEQYSTKERVTVKRGSHMLELGKGEYVIVGVFNSYEHAEKYSDDLFFKGYQSKFGYISQEKYWYVYVFISGDIEESRRKRDELRQKQVFSKAWVLSVE